MDDEVSVIRKGDIWYFERDGVFLTSGRIHDICRFFNEEEK
jgi:hypothetical protein